MPKEILPHKVYALSKLRKVPDVFLGPPGINHDRKFAAVDHVKRAIVTLQWRTARALHWPQYRLTETSAALQWQTHWVSVSQTALRPAAKITVVAVFADVLAWFLREYTMTFVSVHWTCWCRQDDVAFSKITLVSRAPDCYFMFIVPKSLYFIDAFDWYKQSRCCIVCSVVACGLSSERNSLHRPSLDHQCLHFINTYLFTVYTHVMCNTLIHIILISPSPHHHILIIIISSS